MAAKLQDMHDSEMWKAGAAVRSLRPHEGKKAAVSAAARSSSDRDRGMAMKRVLLVAAVVLALAGCRRTDVRDFAIDMPEATQGDMQAVAAALAPYGGVDKGSLQFDAANHRLTLRYDSMQIAKKNIEMAIAQAGFTANGVTPESIGAKRKQK